VKSASAAAGFFRWARRQLLLTRVHHPALWWTGLAAHVLYCAGMAAGIALVFLHHAQAPSRSRCNCSRHGQSLEPHAPRRAAMPEQRAWFRRYGWANAALSPLVTWLWLVALLSSAAGHTIEWRGRRYRLPLNG